MRHLQDSAPSAQLCTMSASRIPLPTGIKQQDTTQGVSDVCFTFPFPFTVGNPTGGEYKRKPSPFPHSPVQTHRMYTKHIALKQQHTLTIHFVIKNVRDAEQQQKGMLQSQTPITTRTWSTTKVAVSMTVVSLPISLPLPKPNASAATTLDPWGGTSKLSNWTKKKSAQ